MSPHRPRLARLISTGVIAAFATACGAPKSGSSTTTTTVPTGFGQLAVRLVDAPPDKTSDVAEIWVSITQVTAHATTGGWTTVVTKDPALKVNLLTLQDSALDLGFANLPKGTVTQVRLYVSPAEGANYVVLKGDPSTPVPLKVPSGAQSGIKILGPWDIVECSQTAVTLDFDGKKSIWYHPTGHGDEWILRPVIRVKKEESSPVACVTDGTDGGSTVARACQATGDCHEGEMCIGGVCAGGAGAPCAVAAECLSGVCDAAGLCDAGGVGAPCFTGRECTTGTCSATNICGQGGTNTQCTSGEDCLSGICQTDGSCAPVPTLVPQGSACGADTDCISGSCTEGVCDASGQGYPCDGTTQTCLDGLTCSAGACVAPRPG